MVILKEVMNLRRDELIELVLELDAQYNLLKKEHMSNLRKNSDLHHKIHQLDNKMQEYKKLALKIINNI